MDSGTTHISNQDLIHTQLFLEVSAALFLIVVTKIQLHKDASHNKHITVSARVEALDVVVVGLFEEETHCYGVADLGV